MVRPLAEGRPFVRDEVLARVAAGESLRGVCRDAAMPAYGTVQAWRRGDAAFAEALRVARLQGAERGRLAYDEAVAGRILAALAAGAGIREVLRGPGMPSWATWLHWRWTQGALQGEVWRLNQVKRARWQEAARASKARRRGPDYDEALADRVLAQLARGRPLSRVRSDDPGDAGFGLPSRQVIWRWRRERAEFDAAVRLVLGPVGRWRVRPPRAGGIYSEALAFEICERIRGGASLAAVARDPAMPAAGTLYRWVRRRPDFAAEVREACLDRADSQVAQIQAALAGAEEAPAQLASAQALFRRMVTPFPGDRRSGT